MRPHIRLKMPGSKSITNRALLASALSKGKSIIKNALDSDDTAVMIAALRNLGIKIKKSKNTLLVSGGTLKRFKKTIHCGNSGTTIRFLASVLASQPFESALTGDKRMRSRPIQDLTDALNQLGAKVTTKNGFPPIKISKPICGNECFIKGNVSSQFLSGLLLAAPLAKTPVIINIKGELISKPYVDLTIDVMKRFGVKVKREGYRRFFIKAPQKYSAREFFIEGDASSATYFWGISALSGKKIEITNIPKNSLQPDARILEKIQNLKFKSRINCADFPDGAMTLAVLCAFLKGKIRLTGLSNLRVKECDRLRALATELNKIGCKTKELKDGLKIHGDPEKLHGAKIKTYSDHRIAMCFGMAGVFLPGIKIKNPSCVRKTYPNFWKDLQRVKTHLKKQNIILSGMRGSGKTRLGTHIAKKIKRDFFDLDALIEKSARKKIADIVKEKGWRFFRALESKAVRKISGRTGVVISTGGGTLINPKNTRLLKQNGKIFFLECPVEILTHRIKKSKARPSLTGKNFIEELSQVYRQRKLLYYKTADFVLDASRQSNDKIRDLNNKAEKLCKIAARWGIT